MLSSILPFFSFTCSAYRLQKYYKTRVIRIIYIVLHAICLTVKTSTDMADASPSRESELLASAPMISAHTKALKEIADTHRTNLLVISTPQQVSLRSTVFWRPGRTSSSSPISLLLRSASKQQVVTKKKQLDEIYHLLNPALTLGELIITLLDQIFFCGLTTAKTTVHFEHAHTRADDIIRVYCTRQ